MSPAEEEKHRQDVRKLADKFTQYETGEQGFAGVLFGFDARDGIVSKIYKGITVGGMVLSGAMMLPAAPVMGALTATAGAVIARGVMKSVFSDMHDNYKSGFSKFAHFMGVGVIASLVSAGLYLATGVGVNAGAQAVQLAGAVAANVFGSMALGRMFGNSDLRNVSEEARDLADRQIEARESGLSGPTVPQPARHTTVSAEEAQALALRLKEGRDLNHSFVQALEQREVAPQMPQR